MADDAHTPLRSAQDTSLERAVKRLEELERRQRDCEDAVYHVHGQVEQTRRDIADIKMVETIMERAGAGDPDGEPVTADGTSGGWRVDALRPKLRLIIGGLGVAVAAVALPAVGATAAHHPGHHHVTAAHHRSRDGDGDPDGATMGA